MHECSRIVIVCMKSNFAPLCTRLKKRVKTKIRINSAIHSSMRRKHRYVNRLPDSAYDEYYHFKITLKTVIPLVYVWCYFDASFYSLVRGRYEIRVWFLLKYNLYQSSVIALHVYALYFNRSTYVSKDLSTEKHYKDFIFLAFQLKCFVHNHIRPFPSSCPVIVSCVKYCHLLFCQLALSGIHIVNIVCCTCSIKFMHSKTCLSPCTFSHSHLSSSTKPHLRISFVQWDQISFLFDWRLSGVYCHFLFLFFLCHRTRPVYHKSFLSRSVFADRSHRPLKFLYV